MLNPDDYQSSMNARIKETEVQDYDQFHVIGRTGLGSMILWG